MKNPPCDEVLLLQPTRAENEDLYPGYIVNCILNAFFSITAVTFNSVTIQALRRTSSLPKPLKTLLLSLAVSDLGVGLLVQPLYIVVLVLLLKRNSENSPSCAVYTACLLPASVFSVASLFGIMALSTDRFLAIHFHLRYQELVTHKRVVSAVVFLWIVGVVLSLTFKLGLSWNIVNPIRGTIVAACLVVSAVFYYKIYLAVRHHSIAIQAMQIQQLDQSAEMVTNLTRNKKSAVCALYVYLVFLICYLPVVVTFVVAPSANSNTALYIFTFSTLSLVHINSSLNPVIYCWKMSHIRHAIMDMVRSVFSSHN